MAANSGLPEGASFSWGEMWTLLNWLCIEFLAVTGHVLYMWFTPRHHVSVIFLTINEWLWTPKISILFMLLFTSSWQQKLNAYPYANTEKIKYPVSHIAGWCTWSACRLHNLPNQKVKEKITEAQHLSFLSLSLNEKKVKVVITPQYVQSIAFVLFSSRVFSIRWQGLWIKKYKMDYRP